MQCVANYELKAEASVFEDGRWLEIKHPKGLFRARLRNIVRKDFSTPFLLMLHIYFEAADLDVAHDVAEERLVDCLNMLVLVTGCRFSRHRIRQIVDATPSMGAMRTLHMWGDSIGHEDPTPVIDDTLTETASHLFGYDIPPPLRRAMRWYRLGVNSTVPDDQFQYFWFALEILAVYKEATEKVNDKCPVCRSPLYCEKCNAHPKHWPYEKQKIRALVQAVDKNCDEKSLEMLEKARNTLMHGGTLKEIEENLPEPREQIVDTLGKIVFMAVVNEFPKELFQEKLSFLNPSTYVHRIMSGIAHIQTVVPQDANGDFDLSFSGTTMTMVTDSPPQSARPSGIVMRKDQYERLTKLSYKSGDHQEMCRRIAGRIHKQDETHVLLVVPATDMTRIDEAMKKRETGEWQELFREILENKDAPSGGGSTTTIVPDVKGDG